MSTGQCCRSCVLCTDACQMWQQAAYTIVASKPKSDSRVHAFSINDQQAYALARWHKGIDSCYQSLLVHKACEHWWQANDFFGLQNMMPSLADYWSLPALEMAAEVRDCKRCLVTQCGSTVQRFLDIRTLNAPKRSIAEDWHREQITAVLVRCCCWVWANCYKDILTGNRSCC